MIKLVIMARSTEGKKMKVTEKKEQMGFSKQGPSCQNCISFTYTIEKKYSFEELKNKRCSLGGFATTVLKWCKMHEWKGED